jgi:hypothetical protein
MPMPKELRDLMERYCQLGRLLPSMDDLTDLAACDDAELVLDEMERTKAAIDAFLAAGRAEAALAEAERTPGQRT